MIKVNLTLIIEPISDVEDLADLDADRCIVCYEFPRPFEDKDTIYVIKTPFERLPIHGRCLKNSLEKWRNGTSYTAKHIFGGNSYWRILGIRTYIK